MLSALRVERESERYGKGTRREVSVGASFQARADKIGKRCTRSNLGREHAGCVATGLTSSLRSRHCFYQYHSDSYYTAHTTYTPLCPKTVSNAKIHLPGPGPQATLPPHCESSLNLTCSSLTVHHSLYNRAQTVRRTPSTLFPCRDVVHTFGYWVGQSNVW